MQSDAPFRTHDLAGDESLAERLIFFLLQPALIIAVLTAWYFDPANPSLFAMTVVGVQLTLGALERRYPARVAWRLGAAEKSGLIVIALVTLAVGGFAGDLYAQWLARPLTALRTGLRLDIWPHHWPALAQVFLVFLASELLWYWMHRAEHRWPLLWRLSAHGAHHAFKKLNAIHFGANHPIELFWIVLPSALVELLFGVGAPAFGAVLLTTTQTAIVHSNLKLNTYGIGLLFTTNAWHIRHHSADFVESNSNYGCAAILWDRIFGTFADSGVREAGLGAREPTTLEKLLMPLREPDGSVIAPGRK